MQFRPRLNHALLAPGQAARNQLDGINATDDNIILIISVKMRRVMLDPSLLQTLPAIPRQQAAGDD
jgi:hypothetical protein